MSRAEVLARAQAFAEEGMVDSCIIEVPVGETTDEASGVVTIDYDDLYDGKCRVQQRQAEARQHDGGEDFALLLQFELQLPMSVVGVVVGAKVTMTSSLTDPDLSGRVFLARGLAHKTDATSRRIQCIERTG